MAMVTSESIDCVLSTIVLCSVQDQTKVLAEVRRVLKPGGYFFFMEHVHAKERSIMALFQMLLNPLNSFLLDGCNVNRKTWETIHKAGFSEVQCQKFDAGLYYQFAMLRPHISGYALKQVKQLKIVTSSYVTCSYVTRSYVTRSENYYFLSCIFSKFYYFSFIRDICIYRIFIFHIKINVNISITVYKTKRKNIFIFTHIKIKTINLL